MLKSLLGSVFGTRHERERKRVQPIVDEVNEVGERLKGLSEDEAVVDWYDTVYMPIIEAVRKDNILADFPGRTESDLYLWVIDHQHYLRERCNDCDVDAEEAAVDYAERYSELPVLRRVATTMEEFIDTL